MLQEVHCEKENIPMKLAEWGYQGLFSCYSSSKAGVCVLFNNNFNLQIQKAFCDSWGTLYCMRYQSRTNEHNTGKHLRHKQ